MNIPSRKELADSLKRFSVADIAQEAGLSHKTIYRYRWMTSAPTMGTLEGLLPAIARLERRTKGRKR